MIRSRRASTESTIIAILPALVFPRPAQTPANGGSAPVVSSGQPNSPVNHLLTLAEVVARAVGGNSGLVAARRRLQKAQELIAQVNAQGKPQLRADANDTYTTYPVFAPNLLNPTITNPTVPGGGQISVIVDNVSLEVRQAPLNIRSAQALVGAAQTGVSQAQEALGLADLRYQGGLGTLSDVLNALAQLTRIRTNLSDANFFYQTSLAQLVRATGGH
jgi:outer membrane protein TolC